MERIIDSIRRDCLNHMIVFNERHLKRILKRYFEYYHWWRTHLGLEMNTPHGRDVQTPHKGEVIEIADLGGLHHHYVRLAA
ncbi:MAG: integrase core domain-containing protein [Burkholderiales bacterium]